MGKRTLLVLACAGLAASARAQNFGLGVTLGLPNDVSDEVHLDNFDHSEVTGWFDYRIEQSTLLRLTYGKMRTRQARSQTVVQTPTGPVTLPEFKERIEYGTLGVSYLFWEGFYTSGVFAGVGVYGVRPDSVPPTSRSTPTSTRPCSAGTPASTVNFGCFSTSRWCCG